MEREKEPAALSDVIVEIPQKGESGTAAAEVQNLLQLHCSPAVSQLPQINTLILYISIRTWV